MKSDGNIRLYAEFNLVPFAYTSSYNRVISSMTTFMEMTIHTSDKVNAFHITLS